MNKYRCPVLWVASDPPAPSAAAGWDDFDVRVARSAADARAAAAAAAFDVVLADQDTPGEPGLHLLDWFRQRSPASARVLLAGADFAGPAVDALNRGLIHRYLVRPCPHDHILTALRHAARSLLLERSHEDLLQELRRLNLELEARVEARTRELAEANRQLRQKNLFLERLALTDALTGLPNRRAMERLARGEFRRRDREPRPLALALIDADHFKQVNDRHLLSGGDRALVWLGQTLAAAVRSDDAVGRIGGEEFLLLAPGLARPAAAALAERLRATVEAGEVGYNGSAIRLTVSVGLVVAAAGVPAAFEPMRAAADAALARAKAAGRNRCEVAPFPA